ncbi:TIGR03826 family flagellar region protein [Abyssisolibacter fermentans]|uniref:TIGR03826 family flagellar region protein n=1 Tax=Abyssisolibacter fermentans TaxID=1766203 RepID=UPI00083778E6|nr:TIGR03826 family flagellar region protein [Abyssisolibacter fermentans]
MDVRNCKKCGKIYKYDGFSMCLKCRQEEEEEFKKVREYIYDNPSATIPIISEDTGVNTKKILRYLREGRLAIKNNNNNLILACERCGVAINTGRFCEKCAVEIQNELNSSIKQKKTTKKGNKSSQEKMYVTRRLK